MDYVSISVLTISGVIFTYMMYFFIDVIIKSHHQ